MLKAKVQLLGGSHDCFKWNYPSEGRYSDLVGFIEKKLRLKENSYSILYSDEDDRIICQSDEDVDSALLMYQDSGKKSMKFFVRPNPGVTAEPRTADSSSSSSTTTESSKSPSSSSSSSSSSAAVSPPKSEDKRTSSIVTLNNKSRTTPSPPPPSDAALMLSPLKQEPSAMEKGTKLQSGDASEDTSLTKKQPCKKSLDLDDNDDDDEGFVPMDMLEFNKEDSNTAKNEDTTAMIDPLSASAEKKFETEKDDEYGVDESLPVPSDSIRISDASLIGFVESLQKKPQMHTNAILDDDKLVTKKKEKETNDDNDDELPPTSGPIDMLAILQSMEKNGTLPFDSEVDSSSTLGMMKMDSMKTTKHEESKSSEIDASLSDFMSSFFDNPIPQQQPSSKSFGSPELVSSPASPTSIAATAPSIVTDRTLEFFEDSVYIPPQSESDLELSRKIEAQRRQVFREECERRRVLMSEESEEAREEKACAPLAEDAALFDDADGGKGKNNSNSVISPSKSSATPTVSAATTTTPVVSLTTDAPGASTDVSLQSPISEKEQARHMNFLLVFAHQYCTELTDDRLGKLFVRAFLDDCLSEDSVTPIHVGQTSLRVLRAYEKDFAAITTNQWFDSLVVPCLMGFDCSDTRNPRMSAVNSALRTVVSIAKVWGSPVTSNVSRQLFDGLMGLWQEKQTHIDFDWAFLQSASLPSISVSKAASSSSIVPTEDDQSVSSVATGVSASLTVGSSGKLRRTRLVKRYEGGSKTVSESGMTISSMKVNAPSPDLPIDKDDLDDDDDMSSDIRSLIEDSDVVTPVVSPIPTSRDLNGGFPDLLIVGQATATPDVGQSSSSVVATAGSGGGPSSSSSSSMMMQMKKQQTTNVDGSTSMDLLTVDESDADECKRSSPLTMDDVSSLISTKSSSKMQPKPKPASMTPAIKTVEKSAPIIAAESGGTSQVSSKAVHFVHKGVACDGCGVYPIIGVRFKSTLYKNYDLCEKCERKRIHDTSHPMIKLYQPIREWDLTKLKGLQQIVSDCMPFYHPHLYPYYNGQHVSLPGQPSTMAGVSSSGVPSAMTASVGESEVYGSPAMGAANPSSQSSVTAAVSSMAVPQLGSAMLSVSSPLRSSVAATAGSPMTPVMTPGGPLLDASAQPAPSKMSLGSTANGSSEHSSAIESMAKQIQDLQASLAMIIQSDGGGKSGASGLSLLKSATSVDSSSLIGSAPLVVRETNELASDHEDSAQGEKPHPMGDSPAVVVGSRSLSKALGSGGGGHKKSMSASAVALGVSDHRMRSDSMKSSVSVGGGSGSSAAGILLQRQPSPDPASLLASQKRSGSAASIGLENNNSMRMDSDCAVIGSSKMSMDSPLILAHQPSGESRMDQPKMPDIAFGEMTESMTSLPSADINIASVGPAAAAAAAAASRIPLGLQSPSIEVDMEEEDEFPTDDDPMEHLKAKFKELEEKEKQTRQMEEEMRERERQRQRALEEKRAKIAEKKQKLLAKAIEEEEKKQREDEERKRVEEEEKQREREIQEELQRMRRKKGLPMSAEVVPIHHGPPPPPGVADPSAAGATLRSAASLQSYQQMYGQPPPPPPPRQSSSSSALSTGAAYSTYGMPHGHGGQPPPALGGYPHPTAMMVGHPHHPPPLHAPYGGGVPPPPRCEVEVLDQAELGDVTIGTETRMTWQLRNRGPDPWMSHLCKIEFVRGHNLAVTATEIPDAAVGEEVWISLTFNSDWNPGLYETTFRFSVAGKTVSPEFGIKVNVVDPSAATMASAGNSSASIMSSATKGGGGSEESIVDMITDSRPYYHADPPSEPPTAATPRSALKSSSSVVDSGASVSDSLQCPCGEHLSKVAVKKVYGGKHKVYCDLCRKRIKGEVYNCPRGDCKQHRGGYDLCVGCAKEQIDSIKVMAQMKPASVTPSGMPLTTDGPGSSRSGADDSYPKLQPTAPSSSVYPGIAKKDAFKYSDEKKKLTDMGFDGKLVEELLLLHKGQMSPVLATLIEGGM